MVIRLGMMQHTITGWLPQLYYVHSIRLDIRGPLAYPLATEGRVGGSGVEFDQLTKTLLMHRVHRPKLNQTGIQKHNALT